MTCEETMDPVQESEHSPRALENRRRLVLWGGKLLLYSIGFLGAAAFDRATPLGVADWLFEVFLVWVAATWGGPREMIAVAAAGTATMLLGLWSSPAESVPFWMGALNRIVAIGVIWAVVRVARARRIADAARAKAAAEIKILKGLLPICSGCKCVRDSAGGWQSLESYLSDYSEAELTHTYCPACLEKYFPELKDIADRPS